MAHPSWRSTLVSLAEGAPQIPWKRGESGLGGWMKVFLDLAARFSMLNTTWLTPILISLTNRSKYSNSTSASGSSPTLRHSTYRLSRNRSRSWIAAVPVMRLGFPGHSKASFTVRVFPRFPSGPASAGHDFTFFSVTSFIFSTTDCRYV